MDLLNGANTNRLCAAETFRQDLPTSMMSMQSKQALLEIKTIQYTSPKIDVEADSPTNVDNADTIQDNGTVWRWRNTELGHQQQYSESGF